MLTNTIRKQIRNDNATLKQTVPEFKSINEKQKLQISELTTESLKKYLCPPNKPIKVTK